MLSFSEFVFKLVKMDPFRQPITTSFICIKVFSTTFQKPDSVRFLRGDYRMGDRQSVEVLKRLAFISRTSNNIIHACNMSEFHLAGVPNVKVDANCAETNGVFEYLGCF